MIIAAVALGAFLLGVFMIFFGIKLVKFSLKPLVALVFCFGISFGFWNNYPTIAPTAHVAGDRTIRVDYPVRNVYSTVAVMIQKEAGAHQIVFKAMPEDDLVVVASSGGYHHYYQITQAEGRITSIDELREPFGWMTKYTNTGEVE